MSNTITPTVSYRTLNLEGLEIFYREAGPRDAPTVLLLYGFPSSSHMFRNLIPMLADKYHVVAPDFPGYGESSAPSVNDYRLFLRTVSDCDRKVHRKRDIPSAELHLLDTGHFALEEEVDRIGSLMHEFLDRALSSDLPRQRVPKQVNTLLTKQLPEAA
jgi:hypothetical protein